MRCMSVDLRWAFALGALTLASPVAGRADDWPHWRGAGRNGVVAEPARRAYKPLAEINGIFATDTWSHVVLADGRIFCKDCAGNLKYFTTPVAKPGRATRVGSP